MSNRSEQHRFRWRLATALVAMIFVMAFSQLASQFFFPRSVVADRPADESHSEVMERVEPTAMIALTMAADGSLNYQGEKLTLAGLAARLKDFENKAATRVLIEAHSDARTGDVQDVIRRLQELGFQQFTLRAKK